MSEHTVLAVDDSPDELFLLQMAFKKVAPQIRLEAVSSGRDALNYLATIEIASAAMPQYMILDLKMPGMSGFEVLEELQKMPHRPFIVVMSCSRLTEDISNATQLGADIFHTKPSSFTDFCSIVQKLTDFFCSRAPGSHVHHITNLPSAQQASKVGVDL